MVSYWLQPDPARAARYWDAWLQPHRIAIVQALEQAFPRVSSVLELGCASGPNLRLLRTRRPGVRLVGCDISPDLVAYGSARLPGADLVAGALPGVLPQLRPADVVLTCYALAYVPPDGLWTTWSLLGALGSHGLVIAEPMTAGESRCVAPHLGEWAHDHEALARAFKWDVTRHALAEPVQRLEAFLVCRRTEG